MIHSSSCTVQHEKRTIEATWVTWHVCSEGRPAISWCRVRGVSAPEGAGSPPTGTSPHWSSIMSFLRDGQKGSAESQLKLRMSDPTPIERVSIA